MDDEVNDLPKQVTTTEQLRTFYDDPSMLSQQKFMSVLDEHCQTMVL